MRRFAIDLSETLSRGFTWWTGELKSLLPARLGSGERRRKADLVAVVNYGTLVSAIPRLKDVRPVAKRTFLTKGSGPGKDRSG